MATAKQPTLLNQIQVSWTWMRWFITLVETLGRFHSFKANGADFALQGERGHVASLEISIL